MVRLKAGAHGSGRRQTETSRKNGEEGGGGGRCPGFLTGAAGSEAAPLAEMVESIREMLVLSFALKFAQIFV